MPPITPIPVPAVVGPPIPVVTVRENHHRPVGRWDRTNHNHRWRRTDLGDWGADLDRWRVNWPGDHNRRVERDRPTEADVDRNGSPRGGGNGSEGDCGE